MTATLRRIVVVLVATLALLGAPALMQTTTSTAGYGVSVAEAAPVRAASSVDWRAKVIGSTGNWRAYGYRNGNRCWTGPKRLFKSSAVNDGGHWLADPYCVYD